MALALFDVKYSTGNPDKLCELCREEHTDLRDITPGGIGDPLVICEYCAYDRYEQYRPTAANTIHIKL